MRKKAVVVCDIALPLNLTVMCSSALKVIVNEYETDVGGLKTFHIKSQKNIGIKTLLPNSTNRKMI